MSSIYEQILGWITRNAEKHGDAAELMRRAKARKSSWYKLLQGKNVRADTLFGWLENLGFMFVAPDGRFLGANGGFLLPNALAREREKNAMLEGQLALLQKLFTSAVDELAEEKAEKLHLEAILRADLAGELDGEPRPRRGGGKQNP